MDVRPTTATDPRDCVTCGQTRVLGDDAKPLPGAIGVPTPVGTVYRCAPCVEKAREDSAKRDAYAARLAQERLELRRHYGPVADDIHEARTAFTRSAAPGFVAALIDRARRQAATTPILALTPVLRRGHAALVEHVLPDAPEAYRAEVVEALGRLAET